MWFQDEARIGQEGTPACVWAGRGTRPRAVQDTRYASAYRFGAVCPQRGVGADWVMPRADPGRIAGSPLLIDLRTREDEAGFPARFAALAC